MENNYPEMKDVFTCEDCGNIVLKTERCSPDYDICKDCLSNYENKTGWCSVDCRISGRCDQSC